MVIKQLKYMDNNTKVFGNQMVKEKVKHEMI